MNHTTPRLRKTGLIIMAMGVMSSLLVSFVQAMQHEEPKAIVFDQSLAAPCEALREACVVFDEALVRTDRLGEMVHVGLDDEGYFVCKEDGSINRVNRYDVDPELRKQVLTDVLKHRMARKLKVTKFDNGEYKLTAADGLNGGGFGGAFIGSCIGKGLVHFIGHGTILIVSACTGPAAPVTWAALEAAFLPTVIEPLSNVAALGGGIIGGVATGPV